MLLARVDNIREVTMFPLNQRAEDLMLGAPSVPENAALRDLGLRVVTGTWLLERLDLAGRLSFEKSLFQTIGATG